MSGLKSVCSRLGHSLIEQLAIVPPFEITRSWEASVFPLLSAKWEADALKRLLHFFCRHRVGTWSPAYEGLVSRLSAPRVDPFRVVRSGECFLPVEHQQLIYQYLDNLAAEASQDAAEPEECRVASALILADQHAFRPGTISRIKCADFRLHNNGAIHVSAIVIKKQESSERIRVTRRIKREWCPIMRSFFSRREEVVRTGSVASMRLLGWTRDKVSAAIATKLEVICGERWTATDLRHTAAQRHVDAGASADQLAEFLCQNSTLVGNVYFEQSPSQAERINNALAISPIFARIPEIHRTRTLDKVALLETPEENQIGAAPHGIDIAGIGACQLGQSLCDKNPVLSCYGCLKFLAVNDAKVHEGVVRSLRPVVLQFEEAGRGHEKSPAYAQLQRTLTKAQSIANDLRAGEA